MPWGLKRFHGTRDLHFITFSCYRRQPLLSSSRAKRTFEVVLEQVRRQYNFFITGYVVMPEHVHLLMSEPEDKKLASALQVLKQLVAQRLGGHQFWQPRYYDFNVWSELKCKEKLRYLHRNPVKRGLVAAPEDWEWSSFRHWLTGETGVVEIESQWTARRREVMGMPLKVKIITTDPKAQKAPPSLRENGAPSRLS